MQNHRKYGRKGPKMILGSKLNTYYNVESFFESKKYRAYKQCYYNNMARSGVTPEHSIELNIPIMQNDVSTDNKLLPTP